MPTFSAKVADDGSVPLPAELCAKLDIKPGSEVEFFLTLDGQIHFHHLTDIFSPSGAPIAKPPISVREMDHLITDYLAEKHAPPQEKAKRTGKSAAE